MSPRLLRELIEDLLVERGWIRGKRRSTNRTRIFWLGWYALLQSRCPYRLYGQAHHFFWPQPGQWPGSRFVRQSEIDNEE
jgi:hypothetical protein